MKNTFILGLFYDKDQADRAVDELKEKGIASGDISVVVKNNDRDQLVKDNSAGGATAGGIIGGITGLLVGIGAIALPGIGAVLVGGPLLAIWGLTGAAAAATTTISGGVVGALAGGLLGGLVGLGLSESDARTYEKGIREGGVLLAVNCSARDEGIITDTMNDYSASDVKTLEHVDVNAHAYV